MSYIKILGSSGTKTKTLGTSCFWITDEILIDAGNIINSLDKDALKVNHIFLTHAHLDHIIDIPFIIDNHFEARKTPLCVYASKQTIKNLKEHIFNNQIWPDFSSIKMIESDEFILKFIEISIDDEICIDNVRIKPIDACHTDGSFGFIVTKDEKRFVVSGDTSLSYTTIDILNQNSDIKILLLECSFPNRLQKLAKDSKHIAPNDIAKMVSKLKRDDVEIFLYHVKNEYLAEIQDELKQLNINFTILSDRDKVDLDTTKVITQIKDAEVFDRIMDINLKLSSEYDRTKLYSTILTLLREITKSDAGTLYIVNKDTRSLEFKVVQNDSLGIFLDFSNTNMHWEPIPLYLENGEQNRAMVAAVCALDKQMINIQDIYNSKDYDFAGAKKFDGMNGYRTMSMLVVPLTNHENDVIGVIQLINKTNEGDDGYFSKYDEKVIKALSLQAAMSLTNTGLIEGLELFMESFVTAIANAIDAKSRYTSTHISKIAKLSVLIANDINNDEGFYKDVKYTKNDIKEIEIAAKLHDVGKITTPELVMDKPTKLQKLIDGVEIIRLRAQIIKRDLRIKLLTKSISEYEYENEIKRLNSDLDFISQTNHGYEFLRDDEIVRIAGLAEHKFYVEGETRSLITDDEIYNLSVRIGTLTPEERVIMNDHVQQTYDMLSILPFPKKYSNVVHIASNHHEKLNGTGYPRGLTADDLVLEDRILVLSDIFEALTSADRPYKKTKTISEVFKILDSLVKNGEIDGNLVEFFKNSNAFKVFCETELFPEQIDV